MFIFSAICLYQLQLSVKWQCVYKAGAGFIIKQLSQSTWILTIIRQYTDVMSCNVYTIRDIKNSLFFNE